MRGLAKLASSAPHDRGGIEPHHACRAGTITAPDHGWHQRLDRRDAHAAQNGGSDQHGGIGDDQPAKACRGDQDHAQKDARMRSEQRLHAPRAQQAQAHQHHRHSCKQAGARIAQGRIVLNGIEQWPDARQQRAQVETDKQDRGRKQGPTRKRGQNGFS
jgi:hypothetical protein